MNIPSETEATTPSEYLLVDLAYAFRCFFESVMFENGRETKTDGAKRFIDGVVAMAVDATVGEVNKLIEDIQSAEDAAAQKFKAYAGFSLDISPIGVDEDESEEV